SNAIFSPKTYHTQISFVMAFCISYVGALLPCSLSTRTKFAICHNTSKLHRAAYKTSRWNIPGDVGSTPPPSKLHQALCLNGHNLSCMAELPMDYEGKIKETRHLLHLKGENDPIESLIFVDATLRLGVNHHFQKEIEEILRKSYATMQSPIICEYHTLHEVSLFFRLMRQHGRYVSADVFNNFKGESGRFKEELKRDTRGLVELYEAAQLSFEGERILDEAENFSRQILHGNLAGMEDNLRRSVGNKLRYPFHTSIARFTGRNYDDDLGGMYEWGKTLRELALMDLQVERSVYQEELLQVSKWWNELGLYKKLNLARNRPFEFYTWSMVILADYINLSEQRVELTKSVAFIYLIDDIFDVYGTLDELIIFTEAVNKWDYSATDTLPEHMKMCYMTLLDTINGTSQKIYEKHGYNPIDSLKTTWKSLCSAFLAEAKWSASGSLPSANEYLENEKVSSGVYVALVHLFFLMGLGGTNRGSIELNDTRELMSSIAIIVRIWNDLGCAKNEHQNGKDGSYLDCYKKEHINLTAAQAHEHALELVAIEWKRINKESFNLNHDSVSSFKQAALNLARMVPLMYSYDHNQRGPVLEEYVKFMLSD
ncbi:hypothetical protein ABTG41_16840, partial [Acinetobacter baumannii]